MAEKIFADRLKQLRMAKGWSKQALADHLQVSRASVSYWEMGRNWPKMSELIALANIFGCSTDYLLGRTPYPYMAKDSIADPSD